MSESSLNRPVIWKWGKRVGYSVLDQGLFSGANFLLSILLARWLSPEEFGAYAVGFSAFLICFGIYNSLVLDPLMVLGSAESQTTSNEYIKKMFLVQAGTVLIFFLLLTTIAVVAHGFYKTAFFGMAAFVPLVLNIWFLRSVFYVTHNSGKAIIVSSFYAVVLQGGIIVLGTSHRLNLETTLLWQSISCLMAVILGLAISSIIKSKYFFKAIEWHEFWKVTWTYSKWILIATVADGIAYMTFPPLIAATVGVNEAGAFKGIQNLVNPIQQYLVAVSMLILPMLIQRKVKHDFKETRKVLIIVTLLPTILYAAILALFSKQIIAFLYNNPFYNPFIWMVPYFSLFIILLWGRYITTILLRIERTSKALFIGKIGALLIFLISLIPIWIVKKMELIITSMIMVSLVEFFILLKQQKKAS